MDDIHAPTVQSGPTSGLPASTNDKKLSFQELVTQKEKVEAELSALGSVLDSHGVNMSTSLTTFDGYPRADIDVAQIRTTRARIVRLKTDHKIVMGKLEEAVHAQFALGKVGQDSMASATMPAPANQTYSSQDGPTPAIEPPFAKVNTVVAGSPAEQAGMRPGDKVTKFGGANWTNHERLAHVAQVVQQNENRVILVKVLRESSLNTPSEMLELRLTPRRNWGGRGLLGCHLLPL